MKDIKNTINAAKLENYGNSLMSQSKIRVGTHTSGFQFI